MGKHLKKIKNKIAPQADVTPKDAADALREEIVDEVKRIATGVVVSVYQLIEMGRELVELEKVALEAATPKANGKAPAVIPAATLAPIEEDF